MISKPVIVRGGEYTCRIFEMHWKGRDQQLKTIMYIYRLQLIYDKTKNIIKKRLSLQ